MDFRHFLETVDQKHKGAGILPIAKSSGKMLLGLRTCSPSKGTWASFVGHAESNETQRQTAIREFQEETGFTDKVEELEPWIGNDQTFHLFIGSVPTEFKPKLNKEHSEAKWFSYSEAKKLQNMHPKLNRLFK